MESQPQHPEFRNNPENFHSCNEELPDTINKQIIDIVHDKAMSSTAMISKHSKTAFKF